MNHSKPFKKPHCFTGPGHALCQCRSVAVSRSENSIGAISDKAGAWMCCERKMRFCFVHLYVSIFMIIHYDYLFLLLWLLMISSVLFIIMSNYSLLLLLWYLSLLFVNLETYPLEFWMQLWCIMLGIPSPTNVAISWMVKQPGFVTLR